MFLLFGSSSIASPEQKIKVMQKDVSELHPIKEKFKKGLADFMQSIATVKTKLDDEKPAPISLKAFVVKKVTGKLPSFPCSVDWTKIDKPLADPPFHKPSFIPMLIGSSVLPFRFTGGINRKEGLLFQKILPEWIVSGQTSRKVSRFASSYVKLSEPDDALLDFWVLPLRDDSQSGENNESANYCELPYRKKYNREPDCRYVVPWIEGARQLGHSSRSELEFFFIQERRCVQNKTLNKLSDEFMQDYPDFGRTSLVSRAQQRVENVLFYYLMNFCVERKYDVTTKLRNDFNASSPTSNDVSLINLIDPGPTLETLIFTINPRMRLFKYLYATDVKEMFRQIIALSKDRYLIRFIWRSKSSVPVQEYHRNTITYSLEFTPSPVIHTVQQIARENTHNKETEGILIESTYLDEICHGSDSVEQCQLQISDIISIILFNAGKFPLSKCAANNPEVLLKVQDDKIILSISSSNKPIKIRRLAYEAATDSSSIKFKTPPITKFTKRGVLDVTATLYDSIGWILPVIKLLRICLQSLWLQKVYMDDELDPKMICKLEKFLDQLHLFNNFKILRWTASCINSTLELIGFCDASGDGFVAVIYSRTRCASGSVARFLVPRERVISLIIDSKNCFISKMELLCLLMELFSDLKISFINLELSFVVYTDSEVSPAWVRSQRQLENLFVLKRRFDKIRKIIRPADVHYVKSAGNPASGGINSEKFVDCFLWFNGPDWPLDETFPITPLQESTATAGFATSTIEDGEFEFIEYFSNIYIPIRAIARRLGWKTHQVFGKNTFITASEFTSAKLRVFCYQHKLQFDSEIDTLSNNKPLPRRHWISFLSTIINESDGLLRVGGKLARANIPYDQKHPIVFAKCKLVELIIQKIHFSTSLSGIFLSEQLMQEFWVPPLKTKTKKCIRFCTICVRWIARVIQPTLSDFPPVKMNPAPVSSQVGVDLCGIFLIKSIKLRNAPFVCLISKLVHFEIFSDLSLERFLACFCRFISNRCTSLLIKRDNGTNFVGPNRKLKETWERIVIKCRNTLSVQTISKDFIPLFGPTFDGLCETAVKSLKWFSNQMANVGKMIYEDFHTLLKLIESFLNSRPLYPDPNDPEVEPALTQEEVKSTSKENCFSRNDLLVSNSLHPWRKRLAIIFSSSPKKLDINCEDTNERLWTSVSIVQFTNCSIEQGNSSLTASNSIVMDDDTVSKELLINKDSTPPLIQPKNVREDERIDFLKKELERKLSDLWLWHHRYQCSSIDEEAEEDNAVATGRGIRSNVTFTLIKDKFKKKLN